MESLRNGARDFILKDNLIKLTPAIMKALDEVRLVNDRRMFFSALKESEERYRTLMESLPVGMFRSSIEGPGRFLQANLLWRICMEPALSRNSLKSIPWISMPTLTSGKRSSMIL